MWGVYVEFPLLTGQNGSGTATGISSAMGGPHLLESLAPYRTLDPLTSIRLCPYCNQACNGWDQLMNHLCFHYRMVLVCPLCAQQWPGIAEHQASPGEPLWQSSDNRLQGLMRVEPTDTSFQFPTWMDVPDDH